MRRINTWLCGPPDMDNKFTLSQDQHGINVLNFIVHGINNLFTSPPGIDICVNLNKQGTHIIQTCLIDLTFY